MFIPLRDINPTRRGPYLTYGLMLANILVFLNQLQWAKLSTSGMMSETMRHYALIPARFLANPGEQWFTLFSSQFLHGGIGHLASNLLFLHVFGDNIEDRFGRLRYLGLYLFSGVAAGVAQILFDTSSELPMIGASGAIAGVVAAYLLLFPRAPVVSFNAMPLFWLFIGIFPVIPAWLIGAEFLLVNISGVLGDNSQSGIAFAAHLGGFGAGYLIASRFRRLDYHQMNSWSQRHRHHPEWRRASDAGTIRMRVPKAPASKRPRID